MKFTFLIDPVPASRPRVPRFGKPYYLPTYENFRELMKKMMEQVPKALVDVPMRAEITFCKQIPPSFSGKKKDRMHNTYCFSHAVGDLDNLEKSIYDALSEHLFTDDCLIVEHVTRKLWVKERPRIEITITKASYEPFIFPEKASDGGTVSEQA